MERGAQVRVLGPPGVGYCLRVLDRQAALDRRRDRRCPALPRRAGGHDLRARTGSDRAPSGAVTLSFRTDLAGIGAASANRPTIRKLCAYLFHASLTWADISAEKSLLITIHNLVES